MKRITLITSLVSVFAFAAGCELQRPLQTAGSDPEACFNVDHSPCAPPSVDTLGQD